MVKIALCKLGKTHSETKKRTPHYFCEKDYSKEVNSDDFCHIIDKALSTIAERKENADV